MSEELTGVLIGGDFQVRFRAAGLPHPTTSTAGMDRGPVGGGATEDAVGGQTDPAPSLIPALVLVGGPTQPHPSSSAALEGGGGGVANDGRGGIATRVPGGITTRVPAGGCGVGDVGVPLHDGLVLSLKLVQENLDLLLLERGVLGLLC